MLNHTNRSVNNARYNNIDICNGTSEVIFIGDPNKTYTNLGMYLCNYSDGKELTIRFVNFNFITNASTAINLYQDKGVKLTIDVEGKCSIGTTYSGGSILGVSNPAIKDLTFTGNGNMTIYAGWGADATASGIAGGNGGVAIYATKMTVDMSGTLNVAGGNGGNGAKGAVGKSGTPGVEGYWNSDNDQRNPTSGGHGAKCGTGGNGGDGGTAIVTTYLNILSGSVTLTPGSGGAGGTGGTGGNGGKGGNGKKIKAIVWVISDACTGYSGCNGGNAGDGGDAGIGGTAGKAVVANIIVGHYEENYSQHGGWGYQGSPGTPGIGGNAGYHQHATFWGGAAEPAYGTPGEEGKLGNYGSGRIPAIL